MNTIPYSNKKENPDPSLLLCPSCKQRVPIINTKISDSSISVSIKCICNQNVLQTYTLKDYLTILKQIKPKENCQNPHEVAKLSIAYCKKCQKYLCKSCLKKHNNEKKDHLNSLSLMQINNYCPYHEENDINLYCKNCKYSLCNLCLNSDEENELILSHRFHKIENSEYYNNKISKRDLYKNYENSKKTYFNFIYLFDVVYKYFDKKGMAFPYITDPKNTQDKLISFELFIQMYNVYKDNNDMLIEFVNSLFITYKIENQNINSIINLVNNCIFNTKFNLIPFDVDYKEESELSNRNILINNDNIKNYIHTLIEQMHILLISPEQNIETVDYMNTKKITNDSISKIKSIKVLNDSSNLIIIISNNNNIFLYNAITKKLIKTISDIKKEFQTNSQIINLYQLENEDTILITNSPELIIYNFSTSKLLCSFNICTDNSVRIIKLLEIVPQKLIVCSTDNCIRIFQLKKGIITHCICGQLGMGSICKVNESLFCTGGTIDGNIMIWDSVKGGCIYKITKVHKGGISALFLHEGAGKVFSASFDRGCCVFNCENLDVYKKYEEIFDSPVNNIVGINANRIAMSEMGMFNVWIFNCDNDVLNFDFKIRGGGFRILYLDYFNGGSEFVSNGEKEGDADVWVFEP